MIYEFKQKSDLNTEADRFYKYVDKIRYCGSKQESVDQIILINGLNDAAEQDEWMGMMQTFKKFINDSVVSKVDTLVTEQASAREDVKEL